MAPSKGKGSGQSGRARAPKVKKLTQQQQYKSSKSGAVRGKKVRRRGIWVWLMPDE